MPNNKDVENELRERWLKHLIKEAIVVALHEQEVANNQSAQPSQQTAPENSAPSAVPPPAKAPPQEHQETPPQGQETTGEEEAKPSAQFNVDFMIDQLNIVRGGKSFEDPEVYGQLTTYVKNMSDETKVAVENFLKDLARIIVAARDVGSSGEQQQQQASVKNQQQQSKTSRGAQQAAPGPSSPSPQQTTPAGSGGSNTPPIAAS